MKLLIQNNKVAAVAGDSYRGPDATIDMPEGFDVSRISEYEVVDGVPTLPPPPDAVAIESTWVAEELAKADIQVSIYIDNDDTITANAWRNYRKALRARIVGGVIQGDPAEVGRPTFVSPVIIPTVTALQGLLAIDAAGLSAAYETWATDPLRTFAERAFIEKAQTWRRDDPTLAGAATVLELTEEQVDGLFTLAATL